MTIRKSFWFRANKIKRLFAVFLVASLLSVAVTAINFNSPSAEGDTCEKSLTVTVGTDSGIGSLRDILENHTENGDVITFAPFVRVITLTDEIVFSKKNITIDGVAGVTIKGTGAFRLLNSTAPEGTLTLKGLTFHNGNAADSGGGVYAKSDIRAINCIFAGNTAGLNGGGVYAGHDAYLEDCTFVNNKSGMGGGAYAAHSIVLINSVLTRNTADNGGAVYGESDIVLRDCGFAKNVSSGGTVYSEKGVIEAFNTSFFANTAGDNAGIADACAGVVMNHCTFTNNSGGTNTYNVYLRNGSAVTAENCLMTQDGLAGNGYPAIAGNNQLGAGGYSDWFGDNVLTFNYIMPLPSVVGNAALISGSETDAAGNLRSAGNCLYGAVNWTAMSWAVTNNSNSDPGSLRDGVAKVSAAKSDPLITVKPQRYVVYFADTVAGGNTVKLETAITINENIMYIGRLGSDGKPEVTADGQSKTRIFSNSLTTYTIYVYGMNIVNGKYASIYGGAVSSSGSVFAQHCVFAGSLGDNGGAIAAMAYLGSSTLISCVFENNTANRSGGGAALTTKNVLVQGCVFINNKAASGDGGGLCADNGGVITDCVFINNSSAGSFGGGGMFSGYGDATVTGCVFSKNQGKGINPGWEGGGGLAALDDTVLADCIFNDNTAPSGYGGGAWVDSSATLKNCTFINNKAPLGYGGGAYVISNAVVNGCVFNGNTGSNAGALYASNMVITNSTINDNTTTNPASCAIESKYAGNIFHTTVTDNIGGGIRAVTAGYLVNLYNSIVCGNTEADEITLSQIKGSVVNVSSLIEGQNGVAYEAVFGSNAFDPVTGSHKVLKNGIADRTATEITIAVIPTISFIQKADIIAALGVDQLGVSRHAGSGDPVTYGAVERAAGIKSDTSIDIFAEPAGSSVYGEMVKITAVLSAVPNVADLSGLTITFSADGEIIGTAVTDASGTAFIETDSLLVGVLTITADFAGNEDLNECSSSVLHTVAKAYTGTSLISDNNPSKKGETVTFIATVAAVLPGAGTPTGVVEFYDGAVLLGTAPLAGGAAAFSTSGLGIGTHHIVAKYLGDENFEASDSDLDQIVAQSGPPSPHLHYITASADHETTISPAGTLTVTGGSSITFLFSAKEGFTIACVLVDGEPLPIAGISAGYYTFADVRANHTIEVRGTIGSAITLTVFVAEGIGHADFSLNDGPLVTYVSSVALPYGSSLTLFAYAEKGYKFREWKMDGVSFRDEKISIDDVVSSVYLELYFDKGSDSALIWIGGIITALISAGILFWIIFWYRKRYDVYIPEGSPIKGKGKASRKRAYLFTVEGGYKGAVSYRIGEDGQKKHLFPGDDGEYRIPREDVVDDIYLDIQP